MLVLTSTFPRYEGDSQPGFVLELCRRLAREYEVTVLAPRAPGALERERYGDIEVRRYPYFFRRWERAAYEGGMLAGVRAAPWKLLLVPALLLGQLVATVRALRAGAFDVVHAHWLFPQGFVAVIARALARRPVSLLVTSHGGDLYGLRGRAWTGVFRFVARRAGLLAVVSESMRRDALARLGPVADVRVMPMGVDLRTAFVPPPAPQPARAGALFVGRLVAKKGVADLLAALAVLRARGTPVRATIVGSGPEDARLRAEAARLGIADDVEFPGALPNARIAALYRRAAVFVAPFRIAPDGDQEGLGLVLVEAIGCACPVVTTDVAAARDVVGDGSDTHVVARGDVVAIADAIARVVGDPDSAAARAARARDRVAARFDWEVCAARYADALRLLSPSR